MFAAKRSSLQNSVVFLPRWRHLPLHHAPHGSPPHLGWGGINTRTAPCAWAAGARWWRIRRGSASREWSWSAPRNFSIVFAAHSSNDSAPLPLASSLAKALRRAPNTSSDSILPSLFLSARLKRFSSRLLGLASGACSGASGSSRLTGRGLGAGGRPGPCSARDCHSRNAPVRSRKQAAAPARKRAMGISINEEIRHAR